MSTPTFRLPLKVNCLSNNGKVSVSGPYGEVCFKSASNVYQKGNLIIFLPFLNTYETSIFMQAVHGVTLGYTLTLDLKGIGYKVHENEGTLCFSLGYSVPLTLTIPDSISIAISKKSISLTSADYSKLQNFATQIRKFRYPDSYKGAGILYAGEVISCKEGKKT